MAIRYWLGVIQRDHVMQGVQHGFVQVNHGQRGGLDHMRESDGIVYYSPRVSTPDGAPLKAFTAIGRISDDTVYQAAVPRPDGADWRPWRRSVDWFPNAVETPIRPMLALLDFTSFTRNWGVQLRRGLLELSRHDFELIREQMRPPHPDDRRHPTPSR